MARKTPNMTEKLAAALLQQLRFVDGQFRPIIDYKRAKTMTPEQIISEFECDHYPMSVFMGGTNHPSNLQWLTKEEHKHKTNSLDRETHNKVRRNAKKKAKAAVKKAEELDVAVETNATEWSDAAKERQRAYRKAVYDKRKAARRKPHGWSKKPK